MEQATIDIIDRIISVFENDKNAANLTNAAARKRLEDLKDLTDQDFARDARFQEMRESLMLASQNLKRLSKTKLAFYVALRQSLAQALASRGNRTVPFEHVYRWFSQHRQAMSLQEYNSNSSSTSSSSVPSTISSLSSTSATASATPRSNTSSQVWSANSPVSHNHISPSSSTASLSASLAAAASDLKLDVSKIHVAGSEPSVDSQSEVEWIDEMSQRALTQPNTTHSVLKHASLERLGSFKTRDLLASHSERTGKSKAQILREMVNNPYVSRGTQPESRSLLDELSTRAETDTNAEPPRPNPWSTDRPPTAPTNSSASRPGSVLDPNPSYRHSYSYTYATSSTHPSLGNTSKTMKLKNVDAQVNEIFEKKQVEQAAEEKFRKHTKSMMEEWDANMARFEEEIARKIEYGMHAKRIRAQSAPATARSERAVEPDRELNHYVQSAWSEEFIQTRIEERNERPNDPLSRRFMTQEEKERKKKEEKFTTTVITSPWDAVAPPNREQNTDPAPAAVPASRIQSPLFTRAPSSPLQRIASLKLENVEPTSGPESPISLSAYRSRPVSAITTQPDESSQPTARGGTPLTPQSHSQIHPHTHSPITRATSTATPLQNAVSLLANRTTSLANRFSPPNSRPVTATSHATSFAPSIVRMGSMDSDLSLGVRPTSAHIGRCEELVQVDSIRSNLARYGIQLSRGALERALVTPTVNLSEDEKKTLLPKPGDGLLPNPFVAEKKKAAKKKTTTKKKDKTKSSGKKKK
eukprot:TRINITY_DN6573_c0_g1_i5.p1 TRINITY_DN6573_c0_g1~~TRINITY_DN6573_c0_g1_i5.p1  ORF type:complete len:756 (+),score=115.49 TRINITY_DN6573_c0_g1_i5:142-2409(+)